TATFEEMVLEVETTAGSGTYSALWGLTDVTINRTSNIDTSEVPDCDDESVPLALVRQVHSQVATVSAAGVWALQSGETMLDWWYSGEARNVRVRNIKAENDGTAGDTYAEAGPAILASINNSRTKGQKVSAEIEIQFDGVPTRTLVEAS